jgi:spore maturation protein SpmB
MCSTAIAILAARAYQGLFPSRSANPEEKKGADQAEALKEETSSPTAATGAYPAWVSGSALCLLVALIPLTVLFGKAISPWIIPGLVTGFLTFGVLRRVRIYEVFVEGAKEGFQVALKIIPYLVAILVAVAMFRASGAMEAMVNSLGPWTSRVGMPAEALTMALLRPLSGSGAFAFLASVINDPAIGPDSYTGYLVSTLQGCTETTFYVLAVYFGAIQVRRIRHGLAAALTGELAGIIGSVVACSYLYGH